MARSTTRRANHEAILQAQIMAALGRMPGVVVWRNNVGTATHANGSRVEYGVGGKGAPDLLCEVETSGGVAGLTIALWLEVKTPEGVVEPHQRAWHAAARAGGRNIAIVRSVAQALDAAATVKAFGYLGTGWSGDGDDCDTEPPL